MVPARGYSSEKPSVQLGFLPLPEQDHDAPYQERAHHERVQQRAEPQGEIYLYQRIDVPEITPPQCRPHVLLTALDRLLVALMVGHSAPLGAA